MNDRSDDDQKLDALLAKWEAPVCSPNFAARVVGEALAERVVPLPARRGKFVVPLLLVACLLSAGAFAAWERQQKQTFFEKASASGASFAPEKDARISFQLVSASTEGERETGAEKPQVPMLPRLQETPPAADGSVDNGPLQQPRKVHWPRCECGTAAIVCTCSE